MIESLLYLQIAVHSRNTCHLLFSLEDVTTVRRALIMSTYLTPLVVEIYEICVTVIPKTIYRIIILRLLRLLSTP